MRYDCLIVDDEAPLSQSTLEYFNLFGVKTAWAADAASCMECLRENEVALILLDINLGDSSGFDLCRRLRETTNVPILFVSARTSDDDMLLALNIGGDDYVSKPYSLAVLLAKVKAVLKRRREDGAEAQSRHVFGDFCLDVGQRILYRGEREIELKAMEYKLLAYLVGNKGRVITKEEIFQKVWEDSITGDNTLNVHVRRLREKIEENPNEPRYIKTIWGTGYRFEGG